MDQSLALSRLVIRVVVTANVLWSSAACFPRFGIVNRGLYPIRDQKSRAAKGRDIIPGDLRACGRGGEVADLCGQR